MTLIANTYLVTAGSAVTIATPVASSQTVTIKNIEPSPYMGDLARGGHLYSATRYFPIANNGTALFSFTTGDSGAQFESWQFDSSNSSVIASLIEGATITTTGTAIPAYNLNRNYSDTHESVLEGATALTGGTTVLTQYVGASNQSTGGAINNIPVTLAPNTEYGFKFVDVGGVGTNLHVQVEWAEQFNGGNTVWINGAVDEGFALAGGDELQLELLGGQEVTAISGGGTCLVSVMRRD